MTSKESKGGQARMSALTQKQRKALASKAAKARWKKEEMPARPKSSARKPRRSSRNTFDESLAEAQHQLAEAQTQLNFHQLEYNRLRTEIPALMRTVQALSQLRQPQSQQVPAQYPHVSYYPQDMVPPAAAPPLPPNYSVETVMSDDFIPGSQVFEMPPPPPAVPPMRPPIPSMAEFPKPPLPPRGGGMAGNPGQLANEPENLNQFLDDADNDPNNPAGSKWR